MDTHTHTHRNIWDSYHKRKSRFLIIMNVYRKKTTLTFDQYKILMSRKFTEWYFNIMFLPAKYLGTHGI